MSDKRSGLALGLVFLTALAAVSTSTSYAEAVQINARGQFALSFTVGFTLASLMWFL
ncbi:MAG TPA: hypothetical protein VGW38_06700 [Chloroflexota bacterium]|nr:hypothetical protein [Chloroflexota bacterium]